MGRGRQKAKQTKVARKLKYFSPDTDLDALQRELAAGHETHSEEQPDEDDLYARYADYAEDDRIPRMTTGMTRTTGPLLPRNRESS